MPARYRTLACAACWAIPTALLVRDGLPLAALWAVIGLWFAVGTRLPARRGGLCALPVLLAGIAPPIEAPPSPRPGPVRVSGRVAEIVRAPLEDRSFVYLLRGPRLTVAGDVDCVPGDRLEVLARCGQPAIPGVPPSLVAVPATLTVTPGPWSFQRLCGRLRRAFERQLLRLVPGERGAMLATLVLGRATRADRDLSEAHRATGLSHLLAVSGAHAAMLAWLLGMAGRGRQLGASRWRSGAVLALLVLYGGTVGAEPPVLRAVAAFALATIAARSGRSFGIATGLLAPAVLTCLLDPSAFTGPSFLLSYAAVTGLALALPRRPPDGALGIAALALKTSLWATLMTAPLTLAFFEQLAPWTIVLTPILAPLVAVMLLLGLVTAALGVAAPPLAELSAWPLEGLAHSYAWIVQRAAALPGAPIAAWYRPPMWAFALLSASALIAALRRPQRSTVAAIAVAFTLLWFVPLRPGSEPGFRLLAVGHGQAAVLTTERGHQVAIDCGSMQGGFRAARALAAVLDRRALDLLVVTHGDRDHTNGIEQLITRVSIHRALLSATLRHSELHRRLEGAGVEVRLLQPGARVEPLAGIAVLAPAVPPAASSNDQSLWLRARVGPTRILLTGDAQELGTAAALASDFATRCDVLVLPHHGRPNANAARLLARCRPRLCLASAPTADGETALAPLVRHFGAELRVTGQEGPLCVPARTDRTPARARQPP